MRRIFGNIKSLLHFDWPYHGSPGSGLNDETKLQTWSPHGDVSFASKFSPADYAIAHAPKFGYRCLYSRSANDYIMAVSDSFRSDTFDADLWVNVQSSTAGNISAMLAGSSEVFALSVNASRELLFNSQETQFYFNLYQWHHIRLTYSASRACIFADGVKILEASVNNPASVTAVKIGGAHALFDEFCFRNALSGSGVPSKPYNGMLDIVSAGGFGDGHDGNLSYDQSGALTINTYGFVQTWDGSTGFTVQAWNKYPQFARNVEQGDEIMFAVKYQKSPGDLNGRISFRHVISCSGNSFYIDSPVTEFDINEALANYKLYAHKVPNFESFRFSGTYIKPDNQDWLVFRCRGDCYLAGHIHNSSSRYSRSDSYYLSHSDLPGNFVTPNENIFIACGGTLTVLAGLSIKLGNITSSTDKYHPNNLFIAAKKISIDESSFGYNSDIMTSQNNGLCYMAGDLI